MTARRPSKLRRFFLPFDQFSPCQLLRVLGYLVQSLLGKDDFVIPLFGHPFHLRGNRKKLGVYGYLYALREDYEGGLRPWFSAGSGVFLDVGANCGFWSRYVLAQSRASVIAFEPFPPNYEMLLKNILPLPAETRSRITMEPVGLGREESIVLMRECNDDPGSTCVAANGSQPVRITTVDNYCSSKNLSDISIVKIDVEGYEFEVLEGARRTLTSHRPRVICELVRGHLARNHREPELIVKYFKQLRYRMAYIGDDDQAMPCEGFVSDGNYVFTPDGMDSFTRS